VLRIKTIYLEIVEKRGLLCNMEEFETMQAGEHTSNFYSKQAI
jgi:hypothetical protein